ncbi:MAG: imidazole glycerol phosphate synthase subunit HisH [Acidimicrobiia bacterium]|nr:imidazole glycerol phosphate synthase subunit HisH [bacterium]MXX63650.1 imidazole glycerol phosphate synthase subunit HisH [Acidimicrobiia bacterium]MYH56097.1 imidazole glycerol phosphate synthase subunit HisH [Acidimicrobiia bacterium]
MTDPPLVAVIDHGAGNLVSIRHGLERAGARVAIASRPQETASAQALVLPGVGAPGTAMSRLRDRGFIEPIRTWKGPLLGICIGLQLFFEMSEEDGESCLGLERGRVRKIPDAPLLPHIGWNDLVLPRNGSAPDQLFGDIDPEATFYFVHSYVPVPEDDGITIAYAEYPHPFTAAIRNGPRIGVQFHPERSGEQGIRFLANFVAEVQETSRASR